MSGDYKEHTLGFYPPHLAAQVVKALKKRHEQAQTRRSLLGQLHNLCALYTGNGTVGQLLETQAQAQVIQTRLNTLPFWTRYATKTDVELAEIDYFYEQVK